MQILLSSEHCYYMMARLLFRSRYSTDEPCYTEAIMVGEYAREQQPLQCRRTSKSAVLECRDFLVNVGQLEAEPGHAVQDHACRPNQAAAGLDSPAARAETIIARGSVERRAPTGHFHAESRVAIQNQWLKNRVCLDGQCLDAGLPFMPHLALQGARVC